MATTQPVNFSAVRVLTTFTQAASRANITSGEDLPISLGKIKKFINTTPGEIVTGKSYTIDGNIVIAGSCTEVFNDYTNNVATGAYSHAEGCETIATGDYGSHSEGIQTIASGESSHAEGMITTASGDCSHTEGGGTTASGDYSHAEGDATTASGHYSHAEGDGTSASGMSSHTEGTGTTASGNYSHAGGHSSTASGANAFAHGVGLNAGEDNQVVFGTYNEDSTAALVVGNGTSNSLRSNAFEVDADGKIYTNGSNVGVDVCTDLIKTSDIASTYSSTGTSPVNGQAIADALSGLTASSVGGSGKYISAISESNGVITATASNLSTSVASSDGAPVTSDAVNTAVGLCVKYTDVTSIYSSSGTDPVNGSAVASAIANKIEQVAVTGNGSSSVIPAGADLDTYTTPGRYYLPASATDALSVDPPPIGPVTFIEGGTSATLLVENMGSNGVRQTLMYQWSNTTFVRRRFTSGGTGVTSWSPWNSIQGGVPLRVRPTSTLDLNTLLAPCTYNFLKDEYITYVTNGPTVNYDVRLIVSCFTRESTVRQELIALGTPDKIYVRNYDGTNWSTWHTVYAKTDTSPTLNSEYPITSGAVYTAVGGCLKPTDVTSSYSSSGTSPVNGQAIADALGGLDVTVKGGSGKYISAIKQEDGSINATASNLSTSVSSSDDAPVTSSAVYTAVSGCLKPSDVVSTYSSTGTSAINGTAVASAIKTDTYPLLRSYDSSMTTSSPDFNSFTTPGRYYVSASAFQNANNAPFGPTGAKSYLTSGMGCTLLVEEIGNTGVRQIVYIQYRDIVMTRVNRTPGTASTWTRWKSMNADFPIVETPSSANKLDLNSDAMKESNYIYIPSAYVANLLNCPITSGNVTIRIETRRVSTSGTLVSVRQEVRGDTPGVFYERNGTTASNVTTWTHWFMYSGSDTGA